MVTIRAYHPDDCAQIADIYGHHVLHGTGSFETVPPTAEDMAERLAGFRDAGYPVYVAITENNIICGYGYGSAHNFYVLMEHSYHLFHLHDRDAVQFSLSF